MKDFFFLSYKYHVLSLRLFTFSKHSHTLVILFSSIIDLTIEKSLLKHEIFLLFLPCKLFFKCFTAPYIFIYVSLVCIQLLSPHNFFSVFVFLSCLTPMLDERKEKLNKQTSTKGFHPHFPLLLVILSSPHFLLVKLGYVFFCGSLLFSFLFFFFLAGGGRNE